ncbi:MAG: ribosome-binding factor RbfA [Bacteroidota bacterium]|jgi:ribosome-binding factor A
MDSTRQQKYARLIQKEIGTIFQRKGPDYYGKAFVTVTGVKVSPDLGLAYIYLSVYGSKDSQGVIDQVSSHQKEVRRELGNKIRHQARIIPELRFFLDETLDYADRINRLLEETKKQDSGNTGEAASPENN